MAISIRLATTGEELFTVAYDPVNDIRLWELRLRFYHEMKSTPFFGRVFFHEQMLVDDASLVSAYLDDRHPGNILFHVVIREVRPPTIDGRRNRYQRLHSTATQKPPMGYFVQRHSNALSLAKRDSSRSNLGQGYSCGLPTNLRYWAVTG